MTLPIYSRVTAEVSRLIDAIAEETGAPKSYIIESLLRKALGAPSRHRVAIDAAIEDNQWRDGE